MGCLFVLLAGVFPRLALFIVWVARPNLVNVAFGWGIPAAAGHHLPSLRDPDVRAAVHPRHRPDRVGLVLGCLGRHPRYRALGWRVDPATAGARLSIQRPEEADAACVMAALQF